MLDYNTKFDRRESTTVFNEAEIRELVRSHLGGSEIESVLVFTGGLLMLTTTLCSQIIVHWLCGSLLDLVT